MLLYVRIVSTVCLLLTPWFITGHWLPTRVNSFVKHPRLPSHSLSFCHGFLWSCHTALRTCKPSKVSFSFFEPWARNHSNWRVYFKDLALENLIKAWGMEFFFNQFYKFHWSLMVVGQSSMHTDAAAALVVGQTRSRQIKSIRSKIANETRCQVT